MDQEAATAAPPKTTEYKETDVFAWANNLFEYKEELKFELFLINKNYILYKVKVEEAIKKQLEPLFIDGLLEYVLDGAEQGMVVRGFEEAESEENVLQRTLVAKVSNLAETLNWLKTQEHEIEQFVEENHDMKRMKGILVRVSHPNMPKPFYVIKKLPSAQILKGLGAWMSQGSTFKACDASAGLRIPDDAQMLVLDQDLYVFNQSKLDQLFKYNAKKNSIAEKKAAQIEATYKLSFAEGLDMQTAVKNSKSTINKLQKINPGQVSQEKLIEHAEEMGIELMLDETGAIIIMNEKDLRTFVNLLNDDYMESSLTGERWEIQRKRPLKLASSSE